MGHTRHRVLAKKVVDLTFCEFLNLWMSAIGFNGKKGEITWYLSLLSAAVAMTAYLFNSMAALIAGFKLAKFDVCL